MIAGRVLLIPGMVVVGLLTPLLIKISNSMAKGDQNRIDDEIARRKTPPDHKDKN